MTRTKAERKARGGRVRTEKAQAAKPVEAVGVAGGVEAEPAEGGGERKVPTFPVVGIGASAGGLAALEVFLAHMPANREVDLALVLVQHLDPDHKSILRDLVRKCTQLKVEEVTDGMEVEPNRIHIIPPNKDMALLHGRLYLLSPVAPRGLRLPIDYFFRSLAQDQQERAICIVLSGAGTDGTLGLKAIKGAGGMAMVQEPESATYDGMPRSAIATGLADCVLPPEKLPGQLIAYVQHAFGRLAPGVLKLAPPEETGDALQKVLVLLRAQTGHDFTRYKLNTICRRIERRMAVNQIVELDLYVRYLQQNPVEVATLFRELLIGVTHFFRDPEAFAALGEQAVARLLERKGPHEAVRVWVPGCSTGEEAYSIAMLLREQAHKLGEDFKIQVFATDIDHEAIEQARAGLYPSNIAADVSAERLTRFFDQENGGYRIKKTIRDLLVFAEQNVIGDPPFSKVDLISCRNLLIYMGGELQRKVLPLFHYALNQDGYLLLGNAESVGEFGDLFATVDRKWKIYQRRGAAGAGRAAIEFPALVRGAEGMRRRGVAEGGAEERPDVRRVVEDVLLERHTPACVLVNESGEVVYIHGRAGRYLEPASGEARLNILRMAREGLRLELTNALRKAVAQKESVVYKGLHLRVNGETCGVNLLAEPLTEPVSMRGLILVAFEEVPAARVQEAAVGSGEGRAEQDPRIAALERELRRKEEYLQTTVEELETSNEELKSTNEELQSSNEELHSTNEELETSKEELQSVNEELVTVNTELQQKIEELSRASSDINNLLAGAGVSTVFVDHRLCIQRFTPAATQIINLVQHDVGRPVGHIASNLVGYDQLVEDAQAVLETLAPREAVVQTKDGKWYLMRIMPYRSLENVIEGVVLTFVDITREKGMQERLQELLSQGTAARELADCVVQTVREPLVMLDADLRVVSANRSFHQAFGVSPEQTMGRLLYDLGRRHWDVKKLRRLLEEVLPRRRSFRNVRLTFKVGRGPQRVMVLNGREVRQKADKERLILLAMEEGEGGGAGTAGGKAPARGPGRGGRSRARQQKAAGAR